MVRQKARSKWQTHNGKGFKQDPYLALLEHRNTPLDGMSTFLHKDSSAEEPEPDSRHLLVY